MRTNVPKAYRCTGDRDHQALAGRITPDTPAQPHLCTRQGIVCWLLCTPIDARTRRSNSSAERERPLADAILPGVVLTEQSLSDCRGGPEVQELPDEWGKIVQKIENADAIIQTADKSRSPALELGQDAMREKRAIELEYRPEMIKVADAIRRQMNAELAGQTKVSESLAIPARRSIRLWRSRASWPIVTVRRRLPALFLMRGALRRQTSSGIPAISIVAVSLFALAMSLVLLLTLVGYAAGVKELPTTEIRRQADYSLSRYRRLWPRNLRPLMLAGVDGRMAGRVVGVTRRRQLQVALRDRQPLAHEPEHDQLGIVIPLLALIEIGVVGIVVLPVDAPGPRRAICLRGSPCQLAVGVELQAVQLLGRVILPAVGQLRLGEPVAVAVGRPRQRLHRHVEVEVRLAPMLERPSLILAIPLLLLAFALPRRRPPHALCAADKEVVNRPGLIQGRVGGGGETLVRPDHRPGSFDAGRVFQCPDLVAEHEKQRHEDLHLVRRTQ
jgi:hypothetical protein